ncbi:hypothetical protein IFM89_018772 [Coptis chinensis]|uniref:Uncharacterized protein n=1 Tax=Coptis chinensis TaxID=261450 RepID=A0A835HZI6_9MAGN|nr:hypothetical protein IFM89_018772 [Coptis chinensis]
MKARVSRSFRLQRGSSIKLGRSNSSALLSESISPESARFTKYERLSQSMRLPDEWNQDQLRRQKKKKAFYLLNRIFSRNGRQSGRTAENKGQGLRSQKEENKRKSWLSSWLPDPNHRWPVQGW